ncbi:hypothetical protein HNE05_12405 [Aquipseudomonas campi]|uniref:Uncharacterized protein n=1 Tax=Aquipseudomonas campi TaxID=2731681 RepID=A0A6M8F691_9GAMM|nr:hypothetical protein [Pseudomonas campi]QKE64114.1 hypothetical protein HNE05_12405 [Pseudomonas campi]
MKAVLITALAALLGSLQAHAQGPIEAANYDLQVGAAIKSMSAVEVAPGISSLNIIAEGAGRIAAAGAVLRFHALCAIVDTQEGKQITAGSGDCELTSLGGGKLYARFHTLPGMGDRGHLTFSGGTQEFAAVSGKLPVQVTVNPLLVGKPVFFLETLQPADAEAH